jgi:carbamoyl-phosphate synthase large subunit
MNIVVTGVGGDIGNGIGRILRESEFAKKIIGCDLHDEHSGLGIFDECVLLPKADSADYLKALEDVAFSFQADAVVVTSESELRLITKFTVESLVSLPLVMANQKAMSIGFDKLRTIEFISGLGNSTPWTSVISESDPVNYPCILKSREGAGSQSIFILNDSSSLEPYRKLFPDYICQEYVGNEYAEYTCGVYGCADGEVRTIIFRRRLVSGVTTYAELVESKEIKSLCVDIAKALELRGSINIQLRYTDRGPMVFEINPRFSSTVVFRHKLGFTDLVWSLQEQVLNLSTSYVPTRPIGTRVYRVFDEQII